MKKLLSKEFKLALTPFNYISFAFVLMILIPNYPLYVLFFYPTIGFYQIFATGRANNDILFTSLLPVRKRDIVLARCTTIELLEIIEVLLAVPFAFLRNVLYAGTPIEKSVFTEPNVAFFGITLVLYALFNAMFIPSFYKTGYKARFLWPCIGFFFFTLVAESLAFIPATAEFIDATDLVGMGRQMYLLLGCVIFFIISGFITRCRAIKNFEKVSI